MRSKTNQNISGQQLVADFQTVGISRTTAIVAKEAAKQSEEVVMNQLSSVSGGNYLNPENINEAQGDYVVRASIDAHIKKVQAEQLDSLTSAQLNDIMTKDTASYKGKKVRVISITKDYKPFDGYWFDPKNGPRSNELKKQVVEGKIAEINFEKNLIVLEPTRLSRLISSSLKSYAVYVINPQTLMPAVEIHLI